uniref:Uncharacterized protein n=1 Tax=Leersia perrieri TaxID=77586 RepID=A0A0D9VI28_9ORYZ
MASCEQHGQHQHQQQPLLQKESPLGFKEMEWFDGIDLFQFQAPKGVDGRTTAEVPELFGSQAANDAAYYRPNRSAAAFTGGRQSKKARVEMPDDEEDYLIVPDLG